MAVREAVCVRDAVSVLRVLLGVCVGEIVRVRLVVTVTLDVCVTLIVRVHDRVRV